MSVLITRLLAIINSAAIDSTDFHIAQTMLWHYEQLADMTISEMALLCAVSKSKLSKFAHTLGFDDFMELKDSAIQDPHNYDLNFNNNILNYIMANGYQDFTQTIINDIQQLATNIYQAPIKRLAHDLHAYPAVAAFGTVFSELGALDLQYKLAYNGKYILSFSDDKKQEQFTRDAAQDTLTIIYSNSGDFITKNQLSLGQLPKNYFKHAKSKLVVITSNPELAKLSFVDYLILFPHTSSVQNHSILYPIINDLITVEYQRLIAKEQ